MGELELQGRVALVTGGSRGIGRATALELAAAGAAVAVGYRRDAEAAAAVVEQIETAGGRACALAADVGDRAAVEGVVAEAARRLGPVDVLVASAGILRSGTLLDFEEDDFEAMWRTNVKGVVYASAAVAPTMIERGWGRLILVSSNAGIGTALPGTTFYAATKAAVLALTRRLAFELGPHGITVNAVLPGFIDTDMTMGRRTAEDAERITASLNQRSVLGRGVGTPEEIAQVIAFLASERSSFMTGQLVLADGGRTDYLSHV